MERHQVLIICDDPTAAARIGSVVERARMQAGVMVPGESVDATLRRSQGLLLLLLDAKVDATRSDLILRQEQARNVRVAMFAWEGLDPAHRQRASAHRIPVFELPAEIDTLRAWLLALADSAPDARLRTSDRRIAPMAMRSADGVIRFRDSSGMDWSIYDRRTEDRRKGVVTERHFVNHLAEERTCLLQQGELDDFDVLALEAQLGRATTVHH